MLVSISGVKVHVVSNIRGRLSQAEGSLVIFLLVIGVYDVLRLKRRFDVPRMYSLVA